MDRDLARALDNWLTNDPREPYEGLNSEYVKGKVTCTTCNSVKVIDDWFDAVSDYRSHEDKGCDAKIEEVE